ncbi:MAG: tetratricopeptide repeat protein, partial [Acidobacteriota bacterium]|nr:tetratricopeptide repeat protein [Acidobacteriota bacterium]
SLTKQSKVETNFPIAARQYETRRTGNFVAFAKWQREETENPAESDADEEAEERRGDAETQPREEREIAPHELSNFLNSFRRNKRLAFFVLASFVIVVIAGFALFGWFNGQRQPTNAAVASPIDSIAVLPFENAVQDANAEYLSDGITESLINRLSQLSNLKVMSRSSVFRYKGKEQDATKVGGELNVRAVLTGSVKQIGDQLVINVSLDDAQTNQHIWGEQYVRKFANILNVQSEIVQEVSTNLRMKLTSAAEQQLAKRYTDNVEAYQLYLKGNYEWNKHTQKDLQKSIEYYNQALEKDPNYALAYAGLSISYTTLGNSYLPPNEAFPKAKAYAAKALAIDDTLAEAHEAMNAFRVLYEWNWAEAERELKRAQALNPNHADAHHLYGFYLNAVGRFDEAEAEMKRAQEFDPLSPMTNSDVGVNSYYARQYTEAIAQLEKTTNLEPHFFIAYLWLGQAYEEKKMYVKAIETFQKGIDLAERHPQLVASLGRAYALSGERDKANKVLDELREMSKRRYVSPYLFAVVYVGLGDKDQAFAWLEKAYNERTFFLIWLKVEPRFDSLRDDPRFQDLLRRIGLQP